jgi:hypothetical protein
MHAELQKNLVLFMKVERARIISIRPGERQALNFRDRNGWMPVYQARKLIAMVEKYGQAQD